MVLSERQVLIVCSNQENKSHKHYFFFYMELFAVLLFIFLGHYSGASSFVPNNRFTTISFTMEQLYSSSSYLPNSHLPQLKYTMKKITNLTKINYFLVFQISSSSVPYKSIPHLKHPLLYPQFHHLEELS